MRPLILFVFSDQPEVVISRGGVGGIFCLHGVFFNSRFCVCFKFTVLTLDLTTKWLESGVSDQSSFLCNNNKKERISCTAWIMRSRLIVHKILKMCVRGNLFPHHPACCYIRTNKGMDTMGTDCQRWSGLLTVELRLRCDRSSSYSMLKHPWFTRSDYLCMDTLRVWPSPEMHTNKHLQGQSFESKST